MRTRRPPPTFGLPKCRNYKCPRCLASVGEPCVLQDGQPMETNHAERWKEAFADAVKNGKDAKGDAAEKSEK